MDSYVLLHFLSFLPGMDAQGFVDTANGVITLAKELKKYFISDYKEARKVMADALTELVKVYQSMYHWPNEFDTMYSKKCEYEEYIQFRNNLKFFKQGSSCFEIKKCCQNICDIFDDFIKGIVWRISTNDQPYLTHFMSIFEELWKNGIDARNRIRDIEEGIDTEGIEIIQNPVEVTKLSFDLLKSAKEEVVGIFSTANAFHRQEYAGNIQLLKELVKERGINVRILTPSDSSIEETAQKLRKEQQLLSQNIINIRAIHTHLQTKVSILVIDKMYSLVVELKDDMKQTSEEAIGLAIYSNSKSTVLSYSSIFESLWKQTELYEQLKEAHEQLELHDKMQKEFINIAAHELRTPIQPILGLSEVIQSKIKDPELCMLQDVVIRNAKRLQRLSEDILDVTRIESNSLELRKEQFHLNEIVLNTISDFRNQIKKRT